MVSKNMSYHGNEIQHLHTSDECFVEVYSYLQVFTETETSGQSIECTKWFEN